MINVVSQRWKQGWIPYTIRTEAQKRLTDVFHERIGTFGSRGANIGAVPDRAILHELEIQATGSLLPRIWQQSGSCLPPGSLVRMADGTEKQISQILAGDWVVSHTGKRRKVVATQCKRTTEQMREIRVEGYGNALHCTDLHILPSQAFSEWVRACEVKEGDQLPTKSVSEISVDAFDYRTVVSNTAVGVPEYDVWDIEVEQDHTFIADGFVVHNCVGAGGARAYTLAQVGDVVSRGDQEAIKIPFPYATYGVGRQISGARSTGEGSFGGAQAEAIRTFGMLPVDFDNPQIPQPTIKDGWATWTSRQEIQWSHPSGWPREANRAVLEPEASKYQIRDVTQVSSVDELVQGLAQGFGGTIACNFGTKPRVENDVLLGRWTDSWAHQQCIAGYWQHPTLGLIFIIDNQWNDVHGHCPTLYKLGVTGSYWMLASDMEKIIKSRDGEVYLHSNTKGFPLQTIDWGTMGI